MLQSERQTPFVVVRDDGPEAAKLRGAVVAIGNFDGVHRGHRSVIGLAMKRAAAVGKPSAVLTLEPHPRSYFRPDEKLFRLTDERQKLRLLASAGLDGAVVLTFNAALAGLPAEQFVSEILVGRLGVTGVAIGFDFHFGQGRGGSPAFLTEAGKRYGFPVDVAPKLEDEGRPVSSGTIRTALEAGRVVEAAELLGYPWFVSGEVIHGEKRGREMGFPTANLKLDPACGLKHGIYAVRVGLGAQRYDGVASFGRRPTFDNGAPLLEVFLFDFSGDLYGKVLDVALIGWIRPEEKFSSMAALVAQMNLDADRARDALVRNPTAFPPLGQI
ncbi:bifunctional riboflavin kinase/FAD synthetase [Pseudorhodoplanes sp.]|uniref:bifunctional riboflavin kinase/FAD synthetase n=1 Tax=Pseudorhodoplanes sp. TaxID=1934341 RepID=UPI002B9F197F|nr:bifunctional riboflavin kinase/FAD synthetase [Pseudorhodoplanes sp.]HWV52834.1 bifunctional riboflavin kinase/FAD synthetase [Pseudorhodoplanes sp.]